MQPIKKEMWKCPICRHAFNTEREADICLYNHVKERCINHDLKQGFTLLYIKSVYGFHWKLTKKQEHITIDSCFKISYLECCDRPAYRISNISHDGAISVYGKGSWGGGYRSVVGLDSLEDPRPKEELFVDKR